ncbi:MAG: hypothetical protein EHJ95_01210 [Methanobacteriota archaeon]|nr:MAG: hypothetical protein EHJ95_01210 [Euryarchaeota archaeon]
MTTKRSEFRILGLVLIAVSVVGYWIIAKYPGVPLAAAFFGFSAGVGTLTLAISFRLHSTLDLDAPDPLNLSRSL